MFDKDNSAIKIKKVIAEDKEGVTLYVYWHKKNEQGQYISTGFDGELFIPADKELHWLKEA